MTGELRKVVSGFDPAIDADQVPAGDLATYLRTRPSDFTKLLKFRPGTRPVVFYIREVPRTLWYAYVRTASSEPEASMRAFKAGVLKVSGLTSQDGSILADYETSASRDEAMADEDLDRFMPAVVEEIGTVVLQHSFLAGKTADGFRLPPTLASLLFQRQFPSAVASPGDAAGSSSDTSPAASPTPCETERPPSLNAERSGAPTAATAAEMPSQDG